MKISISKNEIGYLLKTTFTFIFINYAANLIGLWVAKMLNEAVYEYPENGIK